MLVLVAILSFIAMLLSRNVLVIFFLNLLWCSYQLSAQEYQVTPHDDLQKVLDNSKNGDIVTLAAGNYFGTFIIRSQITLRGSQTDIGSTQQVIINAQGKGNALSLNNSHITIKHLTIKNWGNDTAAKNAGIYASHRTDNISTNLLIEHNELIGDSFGIYLHQADKATISYNHVSGNPSLPSSSRGNGIEIANVTNSRIANNEISEVRDGIYVTDSQHNIIEQNTMHNLRYGVHYMYSSGDTLRHNNAYQTRAGYALMSSKQLTVIENKTTDSEDYGFLLNFMTETTLSHNHIKNVWTKPENKMTGRKGKGFFVYYSTDNTLTQNVVDSAEVGIHITTGSDNLKIYGNSFINNPTQVKYVPKKKQEWSHAGKGNYWSNYLGWDLDNNGIGDTIFEPNDAIDKLVWQYPEMKVIMDSPAILILRWVQRQFPVLKSPGIKDSYPLMYPPKALLLNDDTADVPASDLAFNLTMQSSAKE